MLETLFSNSLAMDKHPIVCDGLRLQRLGAHTLLHIQRHGYSKKNHAFKRYSLETQTQLSQRPRSVRWLCGKRLPNMPRDLQLGCWSGLIGLQCSPCVPHKLLAFIYWLYVEQKMSLVQSAHIIPDRGWGLCGPRRGGMIVRNRKYLKLSWFEI